MPQINRIRIINFSYNNDKRHIIDEKFNFYRGENALLSLKNGGGKSVLIQLMMQPVIPMIKIQGRSVKDFFQRRKTPTFVLIEWKLEDMGGYLLTGICIANREAQNRESQETEYSIKYFTFTSQYNESNLMDIENIPFIKRENSNIFIMPFKEASDLIQNKSRDSKFDVRYYAQDDGARYGADLASFNISQDEWKNIIARINSDEGGVIEIFEKCKTGQQLMHEWMIKTVEKVIYKDREDHRKLETMLENLVEEMIGNEQYIHEKSVLEQFLNKIGEFGTELESLVKGLDRQNSIEAKLASMHRYLSAESAGIHENIHEKNQSIEEQDRMQKHIDLEERSLDYYNNKEKFEGLQIKHTEINEKLSATKARLDEVNKRRDIQKAAGIYGEIRNLNAQLASIEEDILKVKGKEMDNEEVKRLEYSLKLSYEKRLENIDEQIQKKVDEIKIQQNKISEYRENENKQSRIKEELSHRKGILEKSIEDFLKHEESIKTATGFSVNRNLFGEADLAELEKFLKMLQDKQWDLEKNKADQNDSLQKQRDRQKEIKNEKDALQQEKTDLTMEINEIDRERKLYMEKEEELKAVFLRHGLEFEKRFNHGEALRELKKIVDSLRENQFEFQQELSGIGKTVESLKKGTLHASEEYALFLETNDINFETGENYLRKQRQEIREKLLYNIPLLPYAFILTDDDMAKLRELYPERPLYQLVPLISYGNLNETLDSEGKTVIAGKGINLVSLYNRRMIDTDSIEDYLGELENERREAAARLKHYTELYEEARRDLVTVGEFNFEKGYMHDIESRLNGLIKKKKEAENNIKSLDAEYSALDDRIKSTWQSIMEIDRQLASADRNVGLFKEYLKRNKEYEEDVKEKDKCIEQLENSRREIEKLKGLTEQALQEKNELERQQIDLGRTRNETYSKYNKYINAHEAQILDQSLEEMESRLEAMKREVADSLDRLENDKEDKNKELSSKKRELDRLNLEQREYENVLYDEIFIEKLDAEIKDLNECRAKQERLEREIDTRKKVAESQMNTAFNEVKRLSDMPVPKNEILMNFESRSEDCKRIIATRKKEIDELEKKNRQYSKIIAEIDSNIDVAGFEPLEEYTVSVSIKEDFDTLFKDLKNIRNDNRNDEKTMSTKYLHLANEYRDKNPNIANIFKGLDPIKQQAEKSHENYYYLYERIVSQKDVLGDLIRAYENQLANLERNKNDMVTQCYFHAMQLYDEVNKITRDSSIKLNGKSRPVSMLRIKMAPLEEDTRSRDKMRNYIESCISMTREDMRKDKKKEEIRKNINKYMSSWELLNVISDLSKLVIEAYKIEININNSQYKTWEQVMKENSGGERFVSFFAVLAALMSYTRSKGRAEDDYVRNKDTKVLIMDNPFGPISSEHLLIPLFEIAKKYNTQMICLTDLKQNSILNCFNLIYMLKIRPSTLGTNEYLKVEEQIREGTELERDENLEKAVFKAGDFEQVNLFG